MRSEFTAMLEVLFEVIFTVIAEAFKAAWRHDFPDAPKDPEGANKVEIGAQSSPSHALWDHEIDGHESSHNLAQRTHSAGC